LKQMSKLTEVLFTFSDLNHSKYPFLTNPNLDCDVCSIELRMSC